MSAHVGDLDSVLSVEVFRRAIDDLVEFFQATPDAVVCDLHPDYASTRHAERLSARWDVPLLRVQHHHAHVAACMAEHGLRGPVLGFSWDGTGYGPDGTVWGGEALVCEGAEYRRVAHLRTFALPGGDRAVARAAPLGPGPAVRDFRRKQAEQYAAEWFKPASRHAAVDVDAAASTRRGPAAWAGCSTPWRRSAGCRRSSVSRARRPWRWSLPPTRANGELTAVDIARGQLHLAMLARLTAAGERAAASPTGGRLGAAGPRRVGRSRRRRAGFADQRPLPQRPGRHGRGDRPICRRPRLPIVLTGGCFQNALLTARVRSGCRRPASGCILIIRFRRATAASPWGRCSSPCNELG